MSKARKIGTCLELAEGCLRDARILLNAESRNAAYLASQAAEHLITAIATSEDIHIERRDAHQLDTIVRKIPLDNPDRAILLSISFLEAYATSYRYGTPTGRVPVTPPADSLDHALDRITALAGSLRAHFRVSPEPGGIALQTMPRR